MTPAHKRLAEVRARLEHKQVRMIESWDKASGIHSVSFPDMEADLRDLSAALDVALEALEFECGNRCAEQNPCNAKEARARIDGILAGEGK